MIHASENGRGGWIATPNVDICRKAEHDPAARALLAKAALIVPDGMPLVWGTRLRGDPLPERVSGSSLIFSLTAAAAASGRSIYLSVGNLGCQIRPPLNLPALPRPEDCGHRCTTHRF